MEIGENATYTPQNRGEIFSLGTRMAYLSGSTLFSVSVRRRILAQLLIKSGGCSASWVGGEILKRKATRVAVRFGELSEVERG